MGQCLSEWQRFGKLHYFNSWYFFSVIDIKTYLKIPFFLFSPSICNEIDHAISCLRLVIKVLSKKKIASFADLHKESGTLGYDNKRLEKRNANILVCRVFNNMLYHNLILSLIHFSLFLSLIWQTPTYLCRYLLVLSPCFCLLLNTYFLHFRFPKRMCNECKINVFWKYSLTNKYITKYDSELIHFIVE